jgi:hypothetical protein
LPNKIDIVVVLWRPCNRVAKARGTRFYNGAISQLFSPISCWLEPAPATTSCFAASATLLAPGSSSHIGVNPSLRAKSHTRPVTPQPFFRESESPRSHHGCTFGHAAPLLLELLFLLAHGLRSSVPWPSLASLSHPLPSGVIGRASRLRLGSEPLASTTPPPCPEAPLLLRVDGVNLSPEQSQCRWLVRRTRCRRAGRPATG